MKEMALNITAANYVYEENIDNCGGMLLYWYLMGIAPVVDLLERLGYIAK